jgi:phage terminase small subunit
MARTASNPYGLTDKQWQFAREYLVDLNGTQAAIRAGYSQKTAGQQAEQLLKKAQMIAALQCERASLAQGLEITPERVLQEYARLAFVDMRDLATWGAHGVTFRASDTLSQDAARAVSEVSEETRYFGEDKVVNKRIKTYDKKGALDSLARHLDLFKDGAKLGELGQGLATLLAEARKGPHAGD